MKVLSRSLILLLLLGLLIFPAGLGLSAAEKSESNQKFIYNTQFEVEFTGGCASGRFFLTPSTIDSQPSDSPWHQSYISIDNCGQSHIIRGPIHLVYPQFKSNPGINEASYDQVVTLSERYWDPISGGYQERTHDVIFKLRWIGYGGQEKMNACQWSRPVIVTGTIEIPGLNLVAEVTESVDAYLYRTKVTGNECP